MNTADFNGLIAKVEQHLEGKKNTLATNEMYVFHNKLHVNNESKGISFNFRGLNVTIIAYTLFDYNEKESRWMNSLDTGNSYYILTATQNKKLRNLIYKYLR